ncbi:MAG: BtpA/SgcQ family protein [Candidatus Latescibacteria bacterium]|nr:BtpA/SgcQ family protein [Candidatus Latescibacterota bacterium]
MFPHKFLAAMIAVAPLPGAPLYGGDDDAIVSQALQDLDYYTTAGVDCVVIENSHDLPYVQPPLPDDAVALMTDLAIQVKKTFPGIVGIQVLEAANMTALEIAIQARLDFVRVEGYVFAHVGGAGIIEGCAGKLQRHKHLLGHNDVRFLADVKKKHCSHALTGDLNITDEVKQAEFFLADGIVVTGPRTAEAPDIEELKQVRAATGLPVIIGSGMTAENVGTYFPIADGFITGSTFRREGDFLERLDPSRLNAFMDTFRHLKDASS